MALALLGACSALRFGYNQADELAYWWLDGYLDFTDGQTPKVRQALTRWHVWHRRTQLTDYAALLARVRTDVPNPTSAERVCDWWNDARGRVDVSIDQIIPPAAELMLSLSPEQVKHIERRYAKGNEEFRADYLQADAAQRLKDATKRAVDRADTFYGPLDEVQRERIAKSVADSPFDAELSFSERKQRQQDALQMLRRLKTEGATVDQAQAALRAYIDRTTRSPRPEYQRYAQNLTRYNCAFAANLHNSTSAAQRAILAGKLKGWEGDLRSLAADAAP